MEVRELRSGVLVYRCGEIVICNPEYILECESYPDKFEPIPLNEERLLKFGFEKDLIYNFFTNGKFIIRDDFILCDIDMRIHIKYVHQLQNLYFALTGKELSLKDENTF